MDRPVSEWLSAARTLPGVMGSREPVRWSDFKVVRPLSTRPRIEGPNNTSRPLNVSFISALTEWSGHGPWLPNRPLPLGYALSAPGDPDLPMTDWFRQVIQVLPPESTYEDARRLFLWSAIVMPHMASKPTATWMLLTYRQSIGLLPLSDEVRAIVEASQALDWSTELLAPCLRALPWIDARAAIYGPVPSWIPRDGWRAKRAELWREHGIVLCSATRSRRAPPPPPPPPAPRLVAAQARIESTKQRLRTATTRLAPAPAPPPPPVKPAARHAAPPPALTPTAPPASAAPELAVRPTAQGTWAIRVLICNQPAYTWPQVAHVYPSDFRIDGSTVPARVLVPALASVNLGEPCGSWVVCPHPKAHEAVHQLWQSGVIMPQGVDVLSTLVDHQREAPV